MWCRKTRGYEWSARALNEVSGSGRTWFVTLTLDPEEQYRALATATLLLGNEKERSVSEIFAARVKVIGRDLTKWLKRIRKNSRARIRYLMVAEAHASGDPHFHLLLHEVEGTVLKRQMREAWRLGFMTAKLVDNAAQATYVCKYISKSDLVRVRASFRYGQHDLTTISHSSPVAA